MLVTKLIKAVIEEQSCSYQQVLSDRKRGSNLTELTFYILCNYQMIDYQVSKVRLKRVVQEIKESI